MQVEKKIISNLTKCYSIAPLKYNNQNYFLVAAEKVDRCLLFDEDGNEVDTVWNEPGGVMTMVQIPGSNGVFLATHKFYSPNDSKEAKIVMVTPIAKGNWEVKTLVDLPFVHRFDILECDGQKYLIACTLKSDHEMKDDWRFPGKVWACKLPEDLSSYNENNQLQMEVIADNMLKNHGYTRKVVDDLQMGIVSCDSGVYSFLPPKKGEDKWEITKLLERSASDAVLVDLDGDGEDELGVLAPFHGECIEIYKKINGEFKQVYNYEPTAEFTHSIFGGMLQGKNRFVVGHRKGERDLICFSYDEQNKNYQYELIDHDCGSANVYKYSKDGHDVLISTNREIDEVAMYIFK